MLHVENLSYRYGDHQAVDGLNLRVERGSIFGFLGPNGAGKTTSLKCIAGLLADWSGGMTVDGRPFAPASSIADRKRLGIVPQELALYDNLTPRETLEFFAKINGVPKANRTEAVASGLALAGLEDRARDQVRGFSGGMKRRLNLAIGQVHSPELLLLDEPTAGVDPQSRAHLFETLEQLRDRGMTLIYTTHYMEEAERLCDTIAIINDGRVVSVGSQQELAEQHGRPDANLEDVFLELTGRSLRDEM